MLENERVESCSVVLPLASFLKPNLVMNHVDIHLRFHASVWYISRPRHGYVAFDRLTFIVRIRDLSSLGVFVFFSQ